MKKTVSKMGIVTLKLTKEEIENLEKTLDILYSIHDETDGENFTVGSYSTGDSVEGSEFEEFTNTLDNIRVMGKVTFEESDEDEEDEEDDE